MLYKNCYKNKIIIKHDNDSKRLPLNTASKLIIHSLYLHKIRDKKAYYRAF